MHFSSRGPESPFSTRSGRFHPSTQRTQTRSDNTHPCICHPSPDIRCSLHPLLNSLYRFIRRACRSILHSCDSTGTHLERRTSGPCWLQRAFPIPSSGCDSLATLVLLAPFNYLMQGTPAPIETGEAPPFANTAAANARVVFSN